VAWGKLDLYSLGALNGFYLVFAVVTVSLRKQLNHSLKIDQFPRLHTFLQIFATFLLACVAWVFFRAGSIEDAVKILGKISRFEGQFFIGSPAFFIYSVLGILLLLMVELKEEYFKEKIHFINHRNGLIRKVKLFDNDNSYSNVWCF